MTLFYPGDLIIVENQICLVLSRKTRQKRFTMQNRAMQIVSNYRLYVINDLGKRPRVIELSSSSPQRLDLDSNVKWYVQRAWGLGGTTPPELISRL